MLNLFLIYLQDGQNNNGYVPFLDFSRDYSTPPSNISNGISPAVTSSSSLTSASLDLQYSATYGNPYLRINQNTLPAQATNGQPPPPPPYSIRNGSVPQLVPKVSPNSLQYIVANKVPLITNKNSTQATHV